MTEEEYFIKNYPDSCYGDRPLSPYWDFFEEGVEFGERQSEKKIEELKEKHKQEILDLVLSNSSERAELEKENAELKEKKIKGCYFGKDELGNDFFAKCDCVDCQKRTIALLDLRKEYLNKINKEKTMKDQLTKATEIIKGLYFIIQSRIDYENNTGIADEMWRAEQFIKDLEK